MVRIIILVACFGILAYVGSKLYGMVNIGRNRCASCDGFGYWEGTRGERNQCKSCSGTGNG